MCTISHSDQWQLNGRLFRNSRGKLIRDRSLQRQVTEWWTCVVLSEIARAEVMLRATDNELDWTSKWSFVRPPPTPMEHRSSLYLSLAPKLLAYQYLGLCLCFFALSIQLLSKFTINHWSTVLRGRRRCCWHFVLARKVRVNYLFAHLIKLWRCLVGPRRPSDPCCWRRRIKWEALGMEWVY